jgi:hypothetical protein
MPVASPPADVSDNAAVIGERSQPAFGNPD